METQTTDLSKKKTQHEFCKKLFKMTIVGGAAFWATNLAISRTSIAAEYKLLFQFLPSNDY